jgi:hypothetical protein
MNINTVNLALILSLIGIPLGNCDSAKEEPLPTSRAEWRSLLKWDDACESGVTHIANSGVGFVGVKHYKMPDSSSLVSVVCRTGSYNQGKIVFHLRNTESGRQSTVLVFPQFHFKEPNPDPSKYLDPNVKEPTGTVDLFYTYNDRLLWGNLKIDKDKQTITNNDFFRGGDTGCGMHTMYKLVEGKPQVVEFRAQPHCRVSAEPIEKWKMYPQDVRSSWSSGPIPAN